jgi:hypothetical protein
MSTTVVMMLTYLTLHSAMRRDGKPRSHDKLCVGTEPTWASLSGLKEIILEAFALEKAMTKWIAVVFALAFATSAQAMTPIPVHQPDGMVTQVHVVCGTGMTRVDGSCVDKTTARRCARWHGGVCVRYY